MRRYGSLMLMLGLLLGPAYYVFCEILSGENGQTIILSERAARWTLADGTIEHAVRGQMFRPITLELGPDMNRIAFRLTFEAQNDREVTQSTDEYQIAVLQSDLPIFQRTVQVKLARGTTRSVETDKLAVQYPGAYLFLLQEAGEPRVPVSRVTLQVRTKIEPLLLPLMWSGFALLAAGLAINLEAYLRHARSR